MSISWLTDSWLSVLFLRYSRWALEIAVDHPWAGYPMAVATMLIWVLPAFVFTLPILLVVMEFFKTIELLFWTLWALLILFTVPVILLSMIIFAAEFLLMNLCFALLFAWFDGGKRAAQQLAIANQKHAALSKRRAERAQNA